MSPADISFRIGGEAGQGVESSGAGFAKALTRAGLQVIGVPNYYSRIRGGHNFFTIRAVNQEEPVLTIKETVDVLIALNAETVEKHLYCMASGGAIIVDKDIDLDDLKDDLAESDVNLLALPLKEIATEHGSEVMTNTAALAAAASVTGFDVAFMIGVIEENFRVKGEKIVAANRSVAQDTYKITQEEYGLLFDEELGQRQAPPRLNIAGNYAFALGALIGGCKFVAGYPMTPATSVLEFMANHADDWGLVVKHAEDEIAAVNMCVGAAYAGVRAMVPTSGGGFDLMVEGISLAAMTETPLVVYLAQRPGPATGMATRTAQADLLMAIHASHGEFPRIVMAPHTPEEHFKCGYRALNLAEKYQCVVIVLSDHYNATTEFSLDKDLFDPSSVEIERGKLLTADELDELDEYKRFAITEDGVSPRALPAVSDKAVFLTTGNEHNEDGHLTEDPLLASAMLDKRMRKLKGIETEIRPPFRYGPEEAELTLVSWGSSYGPVFEAMKALNANGKITNIVHFVDLWPFPAEAAREALSHGSELVTVEGNGTGQLNYLIQAWTGIKIDRQIKKYDGRGFTAEYILAHLEE